MRLTLGIMLGAVVVALTASLLGGSASAFIFALFPGVVTLGAITGGK